MTGWTAAAALIAALAAVPIGATMPDAAADLTEEAAAFRPGQFTWRDDLTAAGPVAIVISLPSQLAYVYRGGELLGVSTVSTGKRGKTTPTGAFTILQKKVFHRSNLYSNAPMPYMQRLTWTGIALHAGQLPGYPASHGCIRFPAAFAKRLFDATELGGEVRIIDTPLDGIVPVPRPRPQLPPVLMVDRGLLTGPRADAQVLARAEPAPRIEVASEDVHFAAYDAVFAEGYGAKAGRARR